jgi:hypothetical protein
VTRNQDSSNGSRKTRATMLIVSLAVVSIAVGAAYTLGVFDQAEPEAREPLRITLSSDRLDFGDLNLTDTASRQLILRNDGERPLTARIKFNDSNIRVTPEELILHPGVSSRVVVELVGNRPGGLSGELRVVVDEEDAEPLVVALAGRVWRDDAERPIPAVQEPSNLAQRQAPAPSYPAENEFPRRERQPEQIEAPDLTAEDPGTIKVADASVGRRGETRSVTGGATAAVSSASRRPTSSVSKTPNTADPSSTATDRSKSMLRVVPYDPATSAPIRSLSERPPLVPDQISDEEAANASKIPSKTASGEDGEELPDRLPEEPSLDDDDSRDRKLNEREDDDNDPFVSPTLTISGQSIVRVLGGTARFYPQQINVVGTDMGGPIGLMGAVEFPIVSLAFGESMLFAQLAGVSGGWDSMTGNVQLQLPIQAVDADGDAAPMQLVLTTGTAMERNESGNVVAISGSPRNPGSGLLRLVGIAKIPTGFKNGGEEHLAVFEILASLTFGTSISSNPVPMGLIGG